MSLCPEVHVSLAPDACAEDRFVPSYAYELDAGADLRVAEDVKVSPGASALAGTGVRMAVPRGCVGLVVPRAGFARAHRVALEGGVQLVDPGYRGEVFLALRNLGDDDVEIPRGTRVAQMVVVPNLRADYLVRDDIGKTERGASGAGSSGVL